MPIAPISSPVPSSPVASRGEALSAEGPYSALIGAVSGSLGALTFSIPTALSLLLNNVPLFEAAEKVAVPGSDPSNGWFANAGVFKMAELSPGSAQWAEIEGTLGRPVPQAEREQAIAAAKTLQQNWSALYELAPSVGLGTRIDEWGTLVIDFKTDSLNRVTNPSDVGFQIQSCLGFLKDQVPLFDAAEKVAVPTGDPSNGWFANAGVFKMAELSPESPEWAEIETTLGRPVPLPERGQAIAVAKTLQQNWSTLNELAPRMGLETRIDEWGRGVIDFKTDSLKVAADAFILVGTDASDSVEVAPFSEEDKAVAGEKSSTGEPYVVTVNLNFRKYHLTQSQADHMIFGLRGGDDSVSFGHFNTLPFGATVFGGDGNDYIKGGGGDDYLDGGAGNDEIIGFSGSDTLLGGEGDDWLKGGYGFDKLDGGLGLDAIWAGDPQYGRRPNNNKFVDPDTPAALEQRPYLADVDVLNQWSGGAATGVTSVSVVGDPQSVDRDGVPSKSFTLQAQTTLGTFQFTVVVNDGAGFDSPDQLTGLFSTMPPPYLAAAAQLDQGISILSDLGNPNIGGDARDTTEVRLLAQRSDFTKLLAHELTHVVSFRGSELDFWSPDPQTQWASAAKADGVPVSAYGDTNSTEDLAEFGELYFNAYNNPDQLAMLKGISPERFRIFEELAAAVLATP